MGGPWCFVEIEGSSKTEKEYCDIPFCNEPDCVVFSKEANFYSHYTDFDSTVTNITFGIKIWNPDSFLEANVRIALTLFPLPLSGKEIQDAGIGIEVFMSNKKCGLSFGSVDAAEYEPFFGRLKSVEYTFFSLTWGGGFVSLNKIGVGKPIFIAEYKRKKLLLDKKKDKFLYYSIQGANILWSFPFCSEDNKCEIHTTSSLFQRYWPLGINSVGHDLNFFVRAFHSANIRLLQSPTVEYPRVDINLQDKNNITRIQMTEYEGGSRATLIELTSLQLLDYWNWREFSVSLFADTLSLYRTKETGTYLITELKNDILRKMRWFSISSEDSVAHWTLFCKPSEFSNPPPAWLPECALDVKENGYNGSQAVTNEGLPCLPWASENLLPAAGRKLYPTNKSFKYWNYCRDPKNQNEGTYCYAVSIKEKNKISKKYCRLRNCKSAECKMAGTGNDYIGKVNTTRSNRMCQFWTAKRTTNVQSTTPAQGLKNFLQNYLKPKAKIKQQKSEYEQLLAMHNISISKDNNTGRNIIFVHPVLQKYLNDSLYADLAVINAENFCRNPSRNVAGK